MTLKRITIMLEDTVEYKLRNAQAKLIKKENRSVSFSKILNMALKKEVRI